MKRNKVVASFKNRRVEKGTIYNWSTRKSHFFFHTLQGKILHINIEELKAIFFVRDYKGDKNRHDRYNDIVPGGGKKFKVEFFDCEVITGYCHSYDPDRQGFFLTPGDLKGNNRRIFVVKSAINEMVYNLDIPSIAIAGLS